MHRGESSVRAITGREQPQQILADRVRRGAPLPVLICLRRTRVVGTEAGHEASRICRLGRRRCGLAASGEGAAAADAGDRISESRSADSDVAMLVAFRRGLNELGYAEGRNLMIEYRFADGQLDRLPALFTDLLARRVALIVHAGAVTTEPMLGIMRASQMPIVFTVGVDPVRFGLVASMNRPGGNMTGIATLAALLTSKQTGGYCTNSFPTPRRSRCSRVPLHWRYCLTGLQCCR